MDASALKRVCLAMPGAFEDFPFGPDTSVFKVRAGAGKAKMFALSSLDASAPKIALKCDPALAEQLRLAHPEITGGYHLNKRHWNDVDCTGALDDATVTDMIEDSYDLVVASLPQLDRRLLGWARLSSEGGS